WSDTHMKSCAHVEAHRESVQFRHDEVLEADAFELFGGPEYFGPDESRDVVDNRPLASGVLQIACEAIRAGFQRSHVDAFGDTVGDLGSLSRLKIESVEPLREIRHAVDVMTHHPEKRPRCAGEALKSHIHARAAERGMLLEEI